MSKLFNRFTDKKEKDLIVLGDFIDIYCREKHKKQVKEAFPISNDRLRKVLRNEELTLCGDCIKLLSHGIAKLLICPYDPKPKCKKCKTHCFAPGYRERIRKVMRFSGLYLIKHGRLNLILHYFF
jgi:uncharacterized CHY-type Zn-finger protein